MSDKGTMEMTYSEFQRWAAEYIVDGFLSGGLKGMQLNLSLVIQQQHYIFSKNGGFQNE